ncbi:sugar ABC transporter permease [Treponema sp.]
MSFFSWKGIAKIPMVFVGLSNYAKTFASPRFWISIINTGWFIAGGFLVLMPLAFMLALIITSKLKGIRFFKTAYFLPVVLPITAISLIWTYLLYPNGGLVNSFVELLGLKGVNWLGDPKIAIFIVVLVNEWVYAGLNMLIFAAGMLAIPDELYEAATIDGAGAFQRVLYITIPNLAESFKIFSILCVTGCLRSFDLIFVMTGGGPAHSTEMPALLLYNEAFKYQNFGGGNAIGVFILVVGLALSLLFNKFMATEGN